MSLYAGMPRQCYDWLNPSFIGNRSYGFNASFALDTFYDSLNTRFVGNWPFGFGGPLALDTIRKIAYVGSGGGVFVLDIANPTAPRKAGEIRTRGIISFLQSQDTLLYITNQWDRGIVGLWNVADPSQPVKVADIPLNLQEPIRIFIKGRFLYCSDPDSFRIFDINNPNQPVLLGSIGPYNNIGYITVADSFAFISFEPPSSDTGLRIVNIQNPAAPYEVGSYKSRNIYAIAVAGRFAYCTTDSHGFVVIDISNPLIPHQVGRCSVPGPVCVVVRGSYAYLGARGLTIVDVSNPTEPYLVANLTPAGYQGVEDVVLLDSFAFLTDWSDIGLWVANIKNPLAPFEVGGYRVPGWTTWVEIGGEYAYLCDWDYGLTILNITNPCEPYEVSKFAVEWGSNHIAVRDTIGYLSNQGHGLRILNLSNPADPVEIGFCPTPGAASACAVKSSYAYVADGAYGLRVIDVSNPFAPCEVGNYDTPGYARFVDVGESLAYVADENGGLRIINIKNPAAPYEVGSVFLSNYPVVLQAKDSFAYVGGANGNMVIVNVSEPAHPRPVGLYQTVGPCWGIDISYPYAYVSDWFTWFHIVDISDPSNPVPAGYHWAPNCPYGLKFVSPYVYVTTGLCGLQIYESLIPGLQERTEMDLFQKLTLYPNPAQQSFSIRAPVAINSIRLYDIAGKLVRVYNHIEGNDRFSLAGVPAGVYLVKIQTQDNSTTQKLIVR